MGESTLAVGDLEVGRKVADSSTPFPPGLHSGTNGLIDGGIILALSFFEQSRTLQTDLMPDGSTRLITAVEDPQYPVRHPKRPKETE